MRSISCLLTDDTVELVASLIQQPLAKLGAITLFKLTQRSGVFLTVVLKYRFGFAGDYLFISLLAILLILFRFRKLIVANLLVDLN